MRKTILPILIILFIIASTISCELKSEKPNEFKVYVLFDRVDGLVKDCNVQTKGIQIGKVTNLDIYKNKVIVELTIDPIRKIPKNSEFRQVSIDILGNKSVEVNYSNNKNLIKNLDTIIGSEEKKCNLNDIAIDTLVKSADKIIELVKKIIITKDSTVKKYK